MTKWVRVKITCLIIAWAIKFEGCSGLKSCWGNGAPIASTQQSLKKSFYKWLNRDIYFLERGWIFSLKMKWQQTNKMFTHFIFNTSPRGGEQYLGSARFWRPGSGSAKICRSTGQNIKKNCKKNVSLKTKIWTIEKIERKK